MSYDLVIVDLPVPSIDEQAWQMWPEICDSLAAGVGPASFVFRELHRRITTRFPCISDDESGPWDYGPLINCFGTHIASVGIRGSRIDDVVPFVIETAIEMNLVVFDPQMAEIHRPPGPRH
jgi:hypothetical protein